jgi:GDP-4-dehydro-6-deoxy-D-mannose reductase
VRVLITGLPGFAGPYLAKHLVTSDADAELFGLLWTGAGTVERQLPETTIHLLGGDVGDPQSILDTLDHARPDVVYHLAAASSVSESWSNPADGFRVNTIGTVNLLEGIRKIGLAPTIVVASSAEVYGRACATTDRLHEQLPMHPVSPYGASKASMELAAAAYHEGMGMPIVRLRLFNHTGPRRPARFVASSLARQIAEIETGRCAPELRVGNLDAVRDFTDVRDVARAYRLAALRGSPGEVYNVCSGTGVAIRSLLDRLLDMTDREIAVRQDPARMRGADIPVQVGDPTKFRETTGWQPEIEIGQTLADLLSWWRCEIRKA